MHPIMYILYLIFYRILASCAPSRIVSRGRAWRERHPAHVPRAFCQILLSGYTRGITSTPDVSRARDSAVCLSPHAMCRWSLGVRMSKAWTKSTCREIRIIWIKPSFSSLFLSKKKIWITCRSDSFLRDCRHVRNF